MISGKFLRWGASRASNQMSLWNLLGKSTIVSVSSPTATSEAPIEMASKDGELRVFIVAGEVSGDCIAYRLMASLRNLSPFPVRFAGIGGPMMSKQGLQSLFPIEEISVMGIWELLPHLNKIRVKLKETTEAAVLFKPHVVVTVDSKGFSFRLLKRIRGIYDQQKLSTPILFHYVAPSFWAWKGGEARLGGLAEFIDHILCILPNEDKVCKLHGVSATFVGHPILENALELNLKSKSLVNEWKIEGNSEEFRSKYNVPPGATVISLLPGSRIQEVSRMLPIFVSTMALLKDTLPQLMTVVHVAPNQHVESFIMEAVQQWPVPYSLIPGGSPRLKYDAFSASNAALCMSGTVAVELQLARLPCVVAYRAHLLTEWYIQHRARISYMSLPNILMGANIIPEALFHACTPKNLASLLEELLHDNGSQEEQTIAAEKFLKLLCPSEGTAKNLPGHNTRQMLPDYTPSLIAASTILHYRKP